MLGRCFFISIVSAAIIFIGCHSSASKEVPQIDKKDSVKNATQQPSAQPAQADKSKPMNKNPLGIYVVFDTVIKKDTIRLVLYNDSMMRCSINRLADTFNAVHTVHEWDSSFCNCSIIVPGKKGKKQFILNDSMLIIPLDYGYMFAFGGDALVLLNRTKHSLKFARGDKYNPMISSHSCPYMDLKKNMILTYEYHAYYDYYDAGMCQLDHARYLVDRYGIKKGKFVHVCEVAASSDALDRIDVSAESDSAQLAFFAYMANYKYWERDRFDSSIYQKVPILDTVIGRDTIHINYDNKGIIVAALNGNTDTFEWQRPWIGREWWRGNEDRKIIVPGGKKPVSCIVNDTMIVFSLCDYYRYASVFALKRYSDSLRFIDDELSTDATYIYVDLKKNVIIEDAGKISDGARLIGNDSQSEDVYFTINKYKIKPTEFLQTNEAKSLMPELIKIKEPESFNGAVEFYRTIVHKENWKKDGVPIEKKSDIIPE